MRLLVVSYAFPPYNSIGGVRVGKTVKYLLKRGHDVRVLTAKDQPFQQTLPVEAPLQNVIYSKSLNIRKPVVVVMGKRAQDAGESGGIARNGGLGSVVKKGLGFTLRTFVYFPDANIGWLPYAMTAASSLFKEWKPELIFASSPPPTSLLVAHRLAKKFNIPWVADLRDLWVNHHYYSQPAWRKSIEERLEHRVLSSTAGLVTVSEPLAQTLRAKYQKPTKVVLNGFDPGDYPSSASAPSNDRHVRILYTGAIYPGRQDPAPLFAALRRLGPEAENVRVSFYGSFLNTLREKIAEHGVEHLVEVHTAVPYKDSLKLQTEADVLLLLMWTDPAERGVYTGKLFEYIGARRAILAIGSVDCVAAELIHDRNVGVIANEPDEIAAHLRRWIGQKQEMGAVPRPSAENIAGISREEQAGVLEEFLNDTLESSSKKPA